MIRIIETSTEERKQETITLFNKMKPLLNKGWNFNQAYLHVTGKKQIGTVKRGAFRDLREYAKTQGYNYKDYQWRRYK